jgi:DNA-binding response OmpR family regulator
MNLTRYTILLVEDDPNDVFLLRRAFRKAKLENAVQVVADGDTAVAYLAGQGAFADRARYPLPILILLDLKLPRRSGLEVLGWLRQQAELKRLPVVMLSSSNEVIDINRAYDLGVNSYLVKPTTFQVLLEMIRTLGLYWMIFNEKPMLHEN